MYLIFCFPVKSVKKSIENRKKKFGIAVIVGSVTNMLCSPIVRLNDGLVVGKFAQTESGFKYTAFQGMRYAKPPVLDRRFKAPEPFDPWNGFYNATYEKDKCLQFKSSENIVGNEDCLYINVYTPKRLSCFRFVQILLPVMVWIHGGGFIYGSGNREYYGPDYIVEQNVILVTLNYRLGVMGFMNLGVDDVPGNAGLRDQVMALRWVKENIQAFGGNPNDVTIFGESTGGASMQYLMLSPMANGLFHKVISHSGSALSGWSFVSKNVNMTERAVDLARLSNRDPKSITELIKILREIPARDLITNAHKMRSFDDRMRDAAFVFAPSVEKKYKHVENFLTKTPIELFQAGDFLKVPYISGYNSAEGIYYIHYAEKNEGHIDTLNKNFQYVIPTDMNLEMNSPKSVEVAKLIKDFYFDGKSIDNSTMYDFIDLYTDYAFLYKILLSSYFIKKYSSYPVYLYEFAFDGDFNYYKKYNNLNYNGSCHMDDLGYLFREGDSLRNYDTVTMSMIVRRRMVKIWTNFAKYGNPTPNIDNDIQVYWKPIIGDSTRYLEINRKMKMKIDPESKRMTFWKNLYKRYQNITLNRGV